jgi:hypothetical protein
MTDLLGHKLNRFLSFLLIIIMTVLLINKVVYTHVHVQASGAVVTHAHPFSKEGQNHPESSHQHSNAMIFLLDQLDVLILGMIASLVIVHCARPVSYSDPVVDRLLTAFVPFIPGRAPPACM